MSEAGQGFRQFYPHYRMALAHWLAENFDFSPTTLARVVKRNLRKRKEDDRKFLQLLRKRLYADYQQAGERPTLLEEVAKLVECASNGSGNGGLYRIVNFNFDDLLERELRKSDIRARPVYSEESCLRDELEVLHPHGFLPRTGQIPAQELVFTEDEYHKLSLQPFNWATTELASMLRNSVCLFVGLSMTDPNLRRMLDACRGRDRKVRHYVIRRDYDVANIDLDDAVAQVQTRAEHEGQRRRCTKQREPQEKSARGVRGAIQQMLKQAHTYDRQLLSELRVGAIWVRDFDDMPNLLRALIDYDD